MLSQTLVIRRFRHADGRTVRDLFASVNRALAPPAMRVRFESYIAQSIREEIGRIGDYYDEHGGSFWVAERADAIVGMFGLEAASAGAMEQRRMYVALSARRQGIGRALLESAEAECRRRGIAEIVLSTSELQDESLALYRSGGYVQVQEEIADTPGNKTVGGGIRRYHFRKNVMPEMPALDTLAVAC